jgi:hypothetical protein
LIKVESVKRRKQHNALNLATVLVVHVSSKCSVGEMLMSIHQANRERVEISVQACNESRQPKAGEPNTHSTPT